MRHENSVFHGLTKLVPWPAFERLAAAHGADRGVRRLSTKAQFLALLYGRLSGAESLREVEAALASHAARLYHLGAAAPARSTLADANARRPAAVFAGLLSQLMGQAGRGLRRELGEAVRLIDSTRLNLSGLGAQWARFSARCCGAKAHVIYDPDADCPLYLAVSAQRANDITLAKRMPLEPGATYVFDLGYYDYAWWAKLDALGCRIVTRFKRNTPLGEPESRPLPPGSTLISDRVGRLPLRQAGNRVNPFAAAVREIRAYNESGKELRLLTNDLVSPADRIADLYRRRWAVELFFRWVKQALKIARFLGRSENAVRIQIAVALIAFVLLRLAHAAHRFQGSLLAFARLVRANLMLRRTLASLHRPPPTIPPDPRQPLLELMPT